MNKLKNLSRLARYNLSILAPGLMRRHDFSLIDDIINNRPVDRIPEPEMKIVNHLIRENSTVIDIGANLGIYLYIFKASGKHDRIIGFEPIPILHKRLQKYFPDMEIYNYAVSDSDQETTFKIPFINGKVFDSRGTLHNFKEIGENKSKLIKVNTITIDSFAVKYDVKNVGFIKIDIEGHELSAIRGAKNIIQRDKPLLMIEIEQRHHEFPIQSIFNEILNLGYFGYFFDIRQNNLRPLIEFDLKVHQDIKNMSGYYINNFIFSDKSNLSI